MTEQRRFVMCSYRQDNLIPQFPSYFTLTSAPPASASNLASRQTFIKRSLSHFSPSFWAQEKSNDEKSSFRWKMFYDLSQQFDRFLRLERREWEENKLNFFSNSIFLLFRSRSFLPESQIQGKNLFAERSPAKSSKALFPPPSRSLAKDKVFLSSHNCA